MTKLKDCQQQDTGQTTLSFCLTLMAQGLVPWWNQMHISIFEILQPEYSSVGHLL